MTCQELRSYLEDAERGEAGLGNRAAEIAAHTAICVTCGRVAEEHRELAASLQLVRESAVEVPASLDAAVLANYHRYMSENTSAVRALPVRRRIRLISALAWTAAVAVVLFIAQEEFGVFFSKHQAVTSRESPRTTPVVTTPAETNQPVGVERAREGTHVATAKARVNRKPRVGGGQVSGTTNTPETAVTEAMPMEFRGLMYCDAFSCGGPMEMIRVQLPPSAAGLTPGVAATNEVVYADVLVGPDGIARGIRILK